MERTVQGTPVFRGKLPAQNRSVLGGGVGGRVSEDKPSSEFWSICSRSDS